MVSLRQVDEGRYGDLNQLGTSFDFGVGGGGPPREKTQQKCRPGSWSNSKLTAK